MRTTRREFVRLGCAASLVASRASFHSAQTVGPAAVGPTAAGPTAAGPTVNDIHSQLNATVVDHIARPASLGDVRAAVSGARALRMPISISGGRHAMGGQQFGTATKLVDMRSMDRVVEFDRERGEIEAEAGIMWPALLGYLKEAQRGRDDAWGIVQKQTGADRLTLGGALAANAHGRGLAFQPIVEQIEAFTIVDHTGEVKRCSRTENADLFRLAVGGYGLFGIVTSIRLRLWRRRKVERVVERREIGGLMEAFERRIADGFLYGDFQYATDSNRESFMRRGVFSCYRPAPPETPLTPNPRRFHPEDWARLTYYAHTHKSLAFRVYSKRYIETSGQIYWADDQLSAAYVDDYHATIDRRVGAKVKATEMITEIYVPRPAFESFMEEARGELRERRANVIYGTVRLIEAESTTFLRWAKQRYACVIFNLHVEHTPEAIARAADAFRALVDLAIRRDGSFYLTYHRWATRELVEACYPKFAEFLAAKRERDPEEIFQSDWYRHYRGLFA
jgi:FAD/FMN-containing dehydrogenase